VGTSVTVSAPVSPVEYNFKTKGRVLTFFKHHNLHSVHITLRYQEPSTISLTPKLSAISQPSGNALESHSLGGDTDFLTQAFRGFPHFPRENSYRVPQLGHDRFPPNPFQFSINYHPAILRYRA
jgi:hypothetical protein